MKQAIIYGGTFLFAFVIVTGVIIYLNSAYENIFQFNFSPKSNVHVPDSTKVDSLATPIIDDQVNKTEQNDSLNTEPKDSILLASIPDSASKDSTAKLKQNDETKLTGEIQDNKKTLVKTELNKTEKNIQITPVQNTLQENNKPLEGKEYNDWILKVTSIYSAMEPKKAAKIIQTYSDNVARDILYNMKKKTAAKVVSELSPETANRIFRFE